MKIEFENIQETSFPSFKGGEKELFARMFFDGVNRIMMGRLTPGASIGMHSHDAGSEVILVTRGEGCVVFDSSRIQLREGDVHYCPKGHAHSLINDSDSDLLFFAVVPQQ